MDSNILSVILFGSHARKDHDSKSDLDVCVITKKQNDYQISEADISSLLNFSSKGQYEIVTYSQEFIFSMLKYGSLFLWHLKEEGVVLFGEQYFYQMFKHLAPYTHHKNEIKYHKSILDDLVQSYKYTKFPNEYDLSILFTICRNTCMILSNKFNVSTYGKYSCYKSAKRLFSKIPIDIDLYKYLSEWKNIYERGDESSIGLPTNNYYEEIMSKVELLIIFALGKIPQNDSRN